MKKRVEVHTSAGTVLRFRAKNFEVRHANSAPTSWKATGMSPRHRKRLMFLRPSCIVAVVVR